jgi:hypothetical protein
VDSGVDVAGGISVLDAGEAGEAGVVDTGSARTKVGVTVMTVLEVRSPPDPGQFISNARC